MNSSSLKAILNRIPFKIFVLALLAWQGYQFWDFENGPDSAKMQKINELQGMQTSLANTKKSLEKLETFRRELETKRAELVAMVAKLGELKAQIREKLDDAEFLRIINAEAGRTGLQLERLNPEGLPQKKENYTEQGFQIGFRGIFVQVLVFFHRLTQMQSIAAIDSFTITAPNSQQAGFVRLDGVMRVNGYSYQVSRVDEIGKKPDAGAQK